MEQPVQPNPRQQKRYGSKESRQRGQHPLPHCLCIEQFLLRLHIAHAESGHGLSYLPAQLRRQGHGIVTSSPQQKCSFILCLDNAFLVDSVIRDESHRQSFFTQVAIGGICDDSYNLAPLP